MIYDHFRATGADSAAQGLSDLFNIYVYGDDTQDFDSRWAQAPLASSEIPAEKVLEGWYKIKIRESV